MKGGAFLSEGGYGCVFYPEVSCSGKDTDNRKYISKIQRKDFSAENEIHVGKLIIKIMKKWIEKPLLNNFAPVLSTCPIDVSKLSIDEEDKCTLFKKEQTTDYVIMKVRYVDQNDFDAYLVGERDGASVIRTFMTSYNHLLQSISFLLIANIVHNDIKGQNVIFDTERSLPIVIDFGLSIPITEVRKDNLLNYFYVFAPDYYAWPLEVHLLNYVLHVSPRLDQKAMRDLAREYTSNNTALRAFSPRFRSKFESLCYDELLTYVGEEEEDVVKRVLDNWRTWDNYSLSIMFIKVLFFLVRRADAKYVLDNPFVAFMTQLLLKNIHPDPSRRLSVETTTKVFNLFLYNQEVDKVSVFAELVKQVTDNKESIDAALVGSRRRMIALTRRALRR